MPPCVLSGARGASLLEAVIAAGLLASVLTGVLPVVTTAVLGASASRADLMAAHLARQRLAQLQALTHVRSAAGVALDTRTGLVGGAFTADGTGLSPTGLTPLQQHVAGWSDALDAHGRHLPGADAPPGAAYRRRWGVLAPGGGSCLQLWVEVVPLPARGTGAAHAGAVHCPWGVREP